MREIAIISAGWGLFPEPMKVGSVVTGAVKLVARVH
jgi:hypothetical protein